MYEYVQQNYYYYQQVFYKDVYFYLFIITLIVLIILIVLYFYYKKMYKPIFIRNKKIFKQIRHTINNVNNQITQRINNNNVNNNDEDDEEEIILNNIKILNNNSKVQIGCPIIVLTYLAVNECKPRLIVENCFREKQIFNHCLRYKKKIPDVDETCIIWQIPTIGKFFQNVVNVRIKLETEHLSSNMLEVEVFWFGCLLAAFEQYKPYIYQCDLEVIKNTNNNHNHNHCNDFNNNLFFVDVVLEAKIYNYILCDENDFATLAGQERRYDEEEEEEQEEQEQKNEEDAQDLQERYFKEKCRFYLVVELYKFEISQIDSFEHVNICHCEKICFGQPTKLYAKWSNVKVTDYTCLFAHVIVYEKCENLEKSAFTCFAIVNHDKCNKNIVLL